MSSIENGNLRAPDDRLRPDGVAHQVVAVQRDVERAGRHVFVVDVAQAVRDAPGERHAARADADERQIARAAVAFEDFVGDSCKGAGHPVRVHDLRHEGTSSRPLRTAVKEFGDDDSTCYRIGTSCHSPFSASGTDPFHDKPSGRSS